MCGIAGFCDYKINYFNAKEHWNNVLIDMRQRLNRRGPDQSGEYLRERVGLSHARLCVRDIVGGTQPMVRGKHAIVYNGELYNSDEIKRDLAQAGFSFETASDTEVILNAFIHYGKDFVKKLNGIFAIAIWDGERLYLYRDHVGVKPLFYAFCGGSIVFASEQKALFVYPDLEPIVDISSLREVFGVGPARTPSNGVFKGVHEVLPAHYLVFSSTGAGLVKYWSLQSRPHEDSYEETVGKVRHLVSDSIKRQLISDVPICSLLSGGVDSSIITAVASENLAESGKILNTFSFDFTGNDEFFEANAFQPERDRPFVEKMLEQYTLNHTFLECGEEMLLDYLYEATDAKDLPGMADIDASLLYFCRLVQQRNKVALTGECADEIFGGYPWFYRDELLHARSFPWSKDLTMRKLLLSPELLHTLQLDDYVENCYHQALSEVPRLDGEAPNEARRREVAYLNLQWFMQTLLTRMDRASMYTGLEARVPFADYRIIEYLWNVPWAMKCRNGVVKGLVRDAFCDYLPPELINRKKSPYPKTYHPNYTAILKARLLDIINDTSSPIRQLVDVKKVRVFADSPQGEGSKVLKTPHAEQVGKPWFGQLMAGPQMMAYLIQTDYWLRKYGGADTTL
ncbi:MAG: asparagine synthase (glutamine-hydrolyzing) [Defluviitaleaceae bacterium]|nr:asparagine synthase (glutamine-hydrolyzing) [Defluviitaleaceae bacterium]